jgi:hypothetical protein
MVCFIFGCMSDSVVDVNVSFQQTTSQPLCGSATFQVCVLRNYSRSPLWNLYNTNLVFWRIYAFALSLMVCSRPVRFLRGCHRCRYQRCCNCFRCCQGRAVTTQQIQREEDCLRIVSLCVLPVVRRLPSHCKSLCITSCGCVFPCTLCSAHGCIPGAQMLPNNCAVVTGFVQR